MYLKLHVEREISSAELEAFTKILPFLKKGVDTGELTLSAETAEPVRTLELPEAKIVPATAEIRLKPVIRKPHRPWRVRVDQAIQACKEFREGKFAENVEMLLETFAWQVSDMAEWVPYTREEIADALVIDKSDVDPLMRTFYRVLNRASALATNCFMLPPTTVEAAKKEEAKTAEREAQNKEQTGDPHVGFEQDTKRAITDALNKLDWESKDRYEMTISDFLLWGKVKDANNVNVIRTFSPVARGMKLQIQRLRSERDSRNRIMGIYAFPPPRNGAFWKSAKKVE